MRPLWSEHNGYRPRAAAKQSCNHWPPTNSGFLSAPGNNTGTSLIAGVMSYFAWNSMQVFHKLAQNFVVCDAWHCDMPGHTAPNRAFMHCATTGDFGIDDNASIRCDSRPRRSKVLPGSIAPPYTSRSRTTIKPGRCIGCTSNCDTDWLNTTVFSQQYDPNNPEPQYNVTQVPIATSFSDLTNGTLPFTTASSCPSTIAWTAACIPIPS